MRYRELPPPPALRPFVRCFWILEDARGANAAERILPDGCVELIVHYGTPMLREHLDGRREQQPAAIVSGQLRTATRLLARGALGMIGARLHPWAAGPFLRVSLSSLTERIVPLDCLWGRDARELQQRIAEADGDEARVALFAGYLLARASPPDETGRALAAALGWIAASRGAIPVARIAHRLAWSRRRLERRCADAVGLSPKSLCRIERFRYVVARLPGDARPRPARLAHLAADAGYADQAHLARDFRELAGLSVTHWLAEQHALSDAFIGGGAQAEA
jgi:AraC-like DNA-binding protein